MTQMNRPPFKTTLILVAAILTTACTTQMAYDSSQNWQKQQCLKINDREERMRCEKSTAMSYEKYRAEAEAVRKPAP